jgi:predicted Zn-dependent protease
MGMEKWIKTRITNKAQKENSSPKRKWLLGTLFLSLFLVACSVVGSLLVSDADEAKLGAQFDAQLRQNTAEYPIMNTNTPEKMALKNYVDTIFQGLLKEVPSKDRPSYFSEFHVTIIEKDVLNAFAVPGGYIYIYTGIIKNMENESELAGVLGHEIAHVTQHHYRRSIAKTAAVSALLTAIAGEQEKWVQYVAGIFNVFAQGKISRDHEEEADKFGTEYLAATERNPTGIATFFSRMKDNFLTNIGLGSHPNPSDRVKEVETQIENMPAWQSLETEEKKNTSRFLEVTAFLRN